jgi:hypothetical protein
LGQARRSYPTRSASAHLGPAAGPVEPTRPQAAVLRRRRGLGVHATANLVSHAYKGWVPRPFACPSRRLYRASRPRPALRGRGLCCSLPPEPQGVPPVARSIRRLCRPSGQTSTTSSFESARRIQGAPPHPRRSTGTTSPVRRPAQTAIVVRRRFAASKDPRSSLSSPGAPRGRAEAPSPGHGSVLPLEVVA